MNNQEILDTYIAVTGKTPEIALSHLESVNWNLEIALNPSQDTHLPRLPDETVNMKLVEDTALPTQITSQDEIFNLYQNIDNFILGKPLSEIKQLGQSKSKPILLYVFNDNLSCLDISRDVLANTSIAEYLKNNFICAKYSDISSYGVELIRNYNILVFPFIAIIDSLTGELLYQVRNTRNCDDFFIEISGYLENSSNSKQEIHSKDIIIVHPSNDDPEGVTICFSIKQENTRIRKRFKKQDCIYILYKFIEQQYNYREFQMHTNFPKTNLDQLRNKTIEQAGVANSLLIIDTNIV